MRHAVPRAGKPVRRDAVKRLDEGMKGSMMDYTIASVAETLIMDVFHYQEAAPEGAVKTEKA